MFVAITTQFGTPPQSPSGSQLCWLPWSCLLAIQLLASKSTVLFWIAPARQNWTAFTNILTLRRFATMVEAQIIWLVPIPFKFCRVSHDFYTLSSDPSIMPTPYDIVELNKTTRSVTVGWKVHKCLLLDHHRDLSFHLCVFPVPYTRDVSVFT